MSDQLGPITFGKKDEQIFLGREIAQHKDYSESTAVMIDQELKKISLEAYERAKKVIEEHREALVRVAEALLEFEVLDGDEVAALVRGEEVTGLAARKRRPTPKPPEAVADATRPPARPDEDDLPGAAISPDPIKQPS